jgi:hypothetical protein
MLSRSSQHQINFTAINRAALAGLSAILNRLLPRGQRKGREFLALNPDAPITISDRSASILIPAAGRISRPATRAATFLVSGSVTSSTTNLPRRTAPMAAPGPRLAFEGRPAALDSANARRDQRAQAHKRAKAAGRAPEP